MRFTVNVLSAGVLLAAALVGPAGSVGAAEAAALKVERPCSDVEAIFARGSGQALNEAQYERFVTQLDSRIQGEITFDAYELGTETYGGARYPAVDVADVWNGNALGGKMSGGQAFDYGDSVWDGITEYSDYLITRAARCPDTAFVTGGFSQGAQVIGQAFQYLPESVRSRLVFNALFGDPKLHLPEGEGIFPDACSGTNLSPWRRSVPDCRVDNGSLGARKPYLPSRWTHSTGLWCADDDFVCGSSKNPLTTSGHNYAEDGGGIDEAAIEIADLLRERFPEQTASFDTSVFVIGTGTTGLDVVFVVDSTGSMTGAIDGAKAYAATMADRITALRGRVALVEYRDAGDEFVARKLSGLDSDLTGFRSALSGISADGGGDTPEALLTGLMTAFDNLDWRPGATKAAVVLTDADYHDPDVATGVTLAQVAARSLEIDPVNVYPVVSEYVSSAYEALAEATSGRVIVDSGDTTAALESALTEISTRPTVLLAVNEYFAQPGEEITFDASRSYAAVGEIASYMWDFDGDGSFEQTTEDPVVSHTYDEPFDGQMQVRVTDTLGGLSNMSVPVHVLPADQLRELLSGPPAPEGLYAKPSDSAVGSVDLAWRPAGEAPDRWAVAVNGVWAGTVDGARTQVTMTDIDRSDDVTFTVASMAPDGLLGESAFVTLNGGGGAGPETPGEPETPAGPAIPGGPGAPGGGGDGPAPEPEPAPGAGPRPGAGPAGLRVVLDGARARVRWSLPSSSHQTGFVVRRFALDAAGDPTGPGRVSYRGTDASFIDKVRRGRSYAYSLRPMDAAGAEQDEVALRRFTALAPTSVAGAGRRFTAGRHLKLPVRWAAERSSAVRYTVQWRRGPKTAWRNWLTATNRVAGVFGRNGSPARGRQGVRHVFRVSSHDRWGNRTRWSRGYAVTVLDDRRAERAGDWRLVRRPRAWLATSSTTRSARSTLTFTIVGRDLVLVGARGQRHSRFAVYVDGRRRGLSDSVAPRRVSRVVLWRHRFPRAREREITVVNLATKGRPLLEVDGLRAE